MDIQRQKDNIDIVDVISKYTNIEKHGKDYTGLCPFHTEKTPSFTVSPAKQIYRCFGCGAGGDVIKFIQDFTHCTFKEACAEIGIDTGDEVYVKPARRMNSAKKRKDFQRRRQKQEQIKREMQTWAFWYESVLESIIDSLNYILPRITKEELEYYAGCISKKSIWEYQLYTIKYGNDEDLYELWTENRP